MPYESRLVTWILQYLYSYLQVYRDRLLSTAMAPTIKKRGRSSSPPRTPPQTMIVYYSAVLPYEGQVFYTSRDWNTYICEQEFDLPVLDHLRGHGGQWPNGGLKFQYVIKQGIGGQRLYAFAKNWSVICVPESLMDYQAECWRRIALPLHTSHIQISWTGCPPRCIRRPGDVV